MGRRADVGRGLRRGRAGAAGLVAALAFTSFAAVSASGSTSAPARTCASLAAGAHGPAVVTIQQVVGATPDGDFGPLTRAAVKHWQRRHGVRASGVVDAATWRALPEAAVLAACGQQVHGSGVRATCAALRPGSLGPAVEVLQRAVGVTVDGDFGPQTLAGVRAAQRRLKLRPTRVVGPATWAALGLTGTPVCITAPPAAGSDAGASGETGTAPPPPPTPPADAAAQAVVRAAVAKLAAALPSTPGTSTDKVALAALGFATSQTGKPYQWGGVGPKGYDCSGLVLASYRAAGITMPRVAADQYAAGATVPLDKVQQGDLVFYAADVTKPSTIYHVALYAGAGKIVDAPYTGAYVGGRALWTQDLLPVAVRPSALLALPVRQGSTGWTVAQLQQALDRHGATLAVDGVDGPVTTAAVQQWQSAHHLSPTGVVDLTTWLTLGEAPQA